MLVQQASSHCFNFLVSWSAWRLPQWPRGCSNSFQPCPSREAPWNAPHSPTWGSEIFKTCFCSFSEVLTSPWPPCTRCSRRWEGSPLCCSCCFSARMCSTCHWAFLQIKIDELLECCLCWVQACPAKASQLLLRPLSFTLEDIFTFTQRLSTIHLW